MNTKPFTILLVITLFLALCLSLLGLNTERTNLTGWFILAFGVAYIAASVISFTINHNHLFFIETHLALNTGYRRPLVKTILAGFFFVFFLPPLEWMVYESQRPHSIWYQYAGLVFIIAGMLLFAWARVNTRELRTRDTSHDITALWRKGGPYRYLRYPVFSAMLFMALGNVVGYSSITGLAVLLLCVVPAVVLRITREEKYLETTFREKYLDYKKTTKRLLPMVW